MRFRFTGKGGKQWLLRVIKSQAENELRNAVRSLKPEEAAVLALLCGRLAKETEHRRDATPLGLTDRKCQNCLQPQIGLRLGIPDAATSLAPAAIGVRSARN